MADFVPSTGNNGEPQKHRQRVDSTSSYVVLRETAKLKGVGNPPKSNTKNETKQQRKDTKKREQTANRGNSKSQLRRCSPGCSHGLCFHRFLQFLVLFFSVAALVLVVLMVSGVVRPDRCLCSQKDTSPRAEKSSQQKNTTEPGPQNTFNMDLSPFYDILGDLKADISSLHKEAKTLMMESEGNKDTLMATKTKLSNTEDAIDLFYNQLYSAIDHVNSTAGQFDPDNGLAFNRLAAVNATIVSKLAEMKKTYDRYNDDIDNAIDAMNGTIAQKVAIKKLDSGPTGERGQNGTKGSPGDTGSTGPIGETGTTGAKGLKGEKGAPGDNGVPGTNGAKGPQGDQGSQGPKGDNGTIGQVGETGVPGPRGIGNFSWCQQKVKSETNRGTVTVRDSTNTKIIGAYCTTDQQSTEANLEGTPSLSSPNEYRCQCKGGPSTANCIMHYMECPIKAP